MRRVIVLALAAALTGLAGCAYFNAMYNAKRLFREAERAAAAGQMPQAEIYWGQSIARAANSYRQSPRGRWADDALYIIGRAHFERGDYRAARGALTELLEFTKDESMAAGARAYLGATEVRLWNTAAGLGYLETALSSGALPRDVETFARLWRGRARLARDDEEGWTDLREVAGGSGRFASAARMEMVASGVRRGNIQQASDGFGALLKDIDGDRWADSVNKLVRYASRVWGPEAVRRLLEPVDESVWSLDQQVRLGLFRAEMAAEAGDTATAEAEMLALVEDRGGSATHPARVRLARWKLARAKDLDELDHVRDLLIPAVANQEARRLVYALRVLDPLMERAEEGQDVALFVAAEICRDELGAPHVARQLFLSFAEAVGEAEWGPKALLAAAALDPPPDQEDRIRELLASHQDNVYVRAASGQDPGDYYTITEERLDRILPVVREQAEREAARRDVTVTRALAMRDTLRMEQVADSMRPHCLAMMDTLSVVGDLADSIKAACLRLDTLRLDSLLKRDTIIPDTTGAGGVRLDTIPGASGHFDPVASLLRGAAYEGGGR